MATLWSRKVTISRTWNLNYFSVKWGLHLYALNESTKLRCIRDWLANERDINIPEARGVNSSDEAVQVLTSCSIFEASESRENNTFF
jgi:hypothetical protein